MSHEPYIAEEPPFGKIDALREFLSRELKRIQNGFIGVDLAVETRFENIQVPITSIKLAGIKDPGFEKILDDGAGSDGIYAYKFAPSSQDEEFFFSVQLPHSYKEGSALLPHIHWLVEETASSAQSVVWGLEYAISNPSTAMPATTIIDRVTATAGGVLQHIRVHFSEITATAAVISAQIIGRVFREQSNGGDTFPNDAAVFEFGFHYERDSHGGVTDHTK